MAQGFANASNMENLRKEIQHVCSGTSDRFVPEPSRKSFQAYIVVAMRRFKNVVRWKEFWRDQIQSTENELPEEEEDTGFKATGLSTSLNPTFGLKTKNHGSDNIEGFLTAVEKTLLKEAFRRRHFERPNKKTREIHEVLQKLKNPDPSVF